jgi:glyoxylase-like metal-dependent hydrolase (beta-lactamase superfamily II)
MRRYGTDEDRIETIRQISQTFWAYAAPVEVDTLIRDGEEIVAGGRTLRAVRRPGHSPTDTVFVDAATGTAFTGDHLLTRISSNPVIHRPESGSMDAADREETLVRYLASLEQTSELDLQEIFPGHGDPGHHPNQLIAKLSGHHQERKEAIGELIRNGATTVSALGEALWGRVEGSQIYLAVSEVLGHTDLMLREGRLRESERNGIVVFDVV